MTSPDPDVPARGRAFSRRRFLGGMGGAVALGAGLSLATTRPASASFMKWGAVVSPSADVPFSQKVDILRRIRPQTARLSMFWGNPNARQFDDGQLDQILGTGVSELIIQSSEDPDSGLARQQLDMLLPYISAHPDILFVWELGNEPDWHQPDNPGLARAHRLSAIRDNKASQSRSNLFWAVNMPAGRWAGDGTGFTFGSSGQWFDGFVRDSGDGLGPMFGGPYSPDIATVHTYSWDFLRRYPERGENNPYKMVDYVRGWSTSISMKITEAGIDGAKSDRGYRYVEFGNSVGGETAGQIDSVCFYGLPPADSEYDIWEGEADQIGTHP